MSRIINFDFSDLGVPTETEAPAERIVTGNPRYKTWKVDDVSDKKIRSGVWEATPGSFRSIKGETWEFCTILSGLIEIVEDGGEPRRYTAGDTFIMRPGFVGTWTTIETVRKVWVTVS